MKPSMGNSQSLQELSRRSRTEKVAANRAGVGVGEQLFVHMYWLAKGIYPGIIFPLCDMSSEHVKHLTATPSANLRTPGQ